MSSARSGGCRQRACCRPGAAVAPPRVAQTLPEKGRVKSNGAMKNALRTYEIG